MSYTIYLSLTDLLRSIHIVKNGSVCVCVHVCMCMCIHHIFFIHSSDDGHSGYFHILTMAIVNNSAVDIEMPIAL